MLNLNVTENMTMTNNHNHPPRKELGRIPFVLLRFPIAGLLLFSGGMKAWETAVEPIVHFPWFNILSVEYEFFLAFLLLLGILPRFVRFLTILTFALFLIVTVHLIAQSADSCGCFGKIHVAPEITAMLDTAVILLLLGARSPASNGLTRRRIFLLLLGMGLTIIPVFGMGRSHPPIYAESVPNDPPPNDEEQTDCSLGYIEPDSFHRVVFKIVNRTDTLRKITKIETGCQCLTVLEAPKTIEPGTIASLLFSFAAPAEKQIYVKKIVVQTDTSDQQLTLTARVGIPLAIEPDQISISPVTLVEDMAVPLTFSNDSATPVRLLYATASIPSAVLKVPSEPIPPHDQKTLTLLIQTPPKERQNTPITLILHTDDSEQSTLTVLVDWKQEESP